MPNLLRWLHHWPTLAPVADRLFLFTPDEGGQIEPAADEVHINDVCYWHLADIGEP